MMKSLKIPRLDSKKPFKPPNPFKSMLKSLSIPFHLATKAHNVESVFKMSCNPNKNLSNHVNAQAVSNLSIKNVSLNGSAGHFLPNQIGNWLK